jgi:zona occludens toxin (predicted ATPase)
MTTYCVAYKNEKTVEWAEKTGNMAGGWVRISAFLPFDEAKRLFDVRKVEYTNNAVAIFANNDTSAWYDRRPRYLANQHILFANAPIGSALSGLINARESDWF